MKFHWGNPHRTNRILHCPFMRLIHKIPNINSTIRLAYEYNPSPRWTPTTTCMMWTLSDHTCENRILRINIKLPLCQPSKHRNKSHILLGLLIHLRAWDQVRLRVWSFFIDSSIELWCHSYCLFSLRYELTSRIGRVSLGRMCLWRRFSSSCRWNGWMILPWHLRLMA